MTSGGSHQAETDGDDAGSRRTAWWWRTRARRGTGKFIEVLGHYNPLTNPPTVKIEVERAQEWIKKGAQPSNTVKHLLARGPPASRRQGVARS